MEEMRAEYLDTLAHIQAVDNELLELYVLRKQHSARAELLRRRKTRLVRVLHEWEVLIQEYEGEE